MTGTGAAPPGWYADGAGGQRWWNGEEWTDLTGDQVASTPAVEGYVLTIGDIGITRTTVVTPNGSAPLRGANFIFRDMSTRSTGIPTWAIVLAIVFALACLLGLLFLLVKEERWTGYAEVTVRSGQLLHTTQLPVGSPQQVQYWAAAVHQAQSLAHSAV